MGTTDSAPTPDDIVVSRASFEALCERVAMLEAAAGTAQAAATDAPRETKSARALADPSGSRRLGRRAALTGLAGAALAGAVAVVGPSSPAAAATGDHLVLGSSVNGADNATGLTVTGTDRPYGFGVTDNGLNTVDGTQAILAHARGQAFDTAIRAINETNGTAIEASSRFGGSAVFALTEFGSAVQAVASGEGTAASLRSYGTNTPAAEIQNLGAGWGLSAYGARGQLLFKPNQGQPTASGVANAAGAIWQQGTYVNGNVTTSDLWACVADGNPGTWRKLAGSATAGAFHLLPSPKRVYDSRPFTTPTQGPKTPLSGNVARTIDLTANASGVPASATGVLLTVLLVNAEATNGNATIWANNQPKPSANTLVWGGNAGRFTTLAVTAVDPSAKVKIDASQRTDVVLDVVGYYR